MKIKQSNVLNRQNYNVNVYSELSLLLNMFSFTTSLFSNINTSIFSVLLLNNIILCNKNLDILIYFLSESYFNYIMNNGVNKGFSMEGHFTFSDK